MQSGDAIRFDIALFDASGGALSYADKTAFEAAGWVLSFIDNTTGSAVSPTLSYTIAPVAGVDGRHTVALTLTTAAWFARVTPPTTSHSWYVLPTIAWTGEQYDIDSLYARVNSIYGISAVTSVPSLTLTEAVEGDSYKCTVTVPTDYLSRMGWTNLTGCTLHGTIRRPTDTTLGTAAATLSASTPYVVINGTDATAFDVYWDTYPSGMVLTTDERTAGSVDFRVEVQATNGAKKLTLLSRATLRVYRQDDNA